MSTDCVIVSQLMAFKFLFYLWIICALAETTLLLDLHTCFPLLADSFFVSHSLFIIGAGTSA